MTLVNEIFKNNSLLVVNVLSWYAMNDYSFKADGAISPTIIEE